MPTPNYLQFSNTLSKVYHYHKLLQESPTNLLFKVVQKSYQYPSTQPVDFLRAEFDGLGFDVIPVKGFFVRRYGLILSSYFDVRKEKAVFEKIDTKSSYLLVVNGKQDEKKTTREDLEASLRTLASFDFDGSGKVTSQPDPDAYREALLHLKQILRTGKFEV